MPATATHAAHDSHAYRAQAAHPEQQLREDLALVDQVLVALQHTRERVSPAEMRSAAASAAIFLGKLSDDTAAVHGAQNNVLLGSARQKQKQLSQLILKTESQADQLEIALGGPLASLPRSDGDTSPEGIRRRAGELAPPGICDDVTMQSAASEVCPLDVAQREATRAVVANQLAAIGANWRAAIGKTYTDTRFKNLAHQDHGFAIFQLLLAVAFEWLGGEAALATAAAGARRRGASRFAHAMHSARVAEESPTLAAAREMIQETGKKLGESAAHRATTMRGHPAESNDLSWLTNAMTNASTDWQLTAQKQVRQLTDPALVMLGEGLQQNDFSPVWFENKINALLERFESLEKAFAMAAVDHRPRTAYVVHPTGAARLALVLPQTLPKQFGKEQYDSPTGRYHFIEWIDSTLAPLAIKMARRNGNDVTLVLSLRDAAWVNSSVKPLAAWATDPADRDDVDMVAPARESPDE